MRTANVVLAWPKWRKRMTFVQRGDAASWNVWAFLCGVCLCGLVFGAVVAGELGGNDAVVLNDAIQRVLTAIQQHQLASARDLWWQRMIGDAQLLALLALFGVSIIGVPFVVMVLFLRAFSLGFAIGFTVIQFGWKGWVLAGVGMFLHQVLSLAVLLCAGVMAIRFSAALLRHIYPLPRLTMALARYTLRFGVCFLGLMPGAFVQAYLTPHLLARMLVSG
ncbi:stage II sporulation protein M [Alicyclobacillus kakegawensis]|uniref:stage II sporulation protein M n=1 Tax=Alicyclobacillus kakegawensis TaxID=392012 RepID=UPI0008339B61|nr:stage II sporulation protein M [Alicyclobacillus kakegawensis]